MAAFKKGDRVVCIESDGEVLEQGERYVIAKSFGDFVWINNFANPQLMDGSWAARRFRHAEFDAATLTAKPAAPLAAEIAAACDSIRDMLTVKNAAYGNSAVEPVRIFSRADPLEQIRVRIDDKLSRLARGSDVPGEDTIDDLLGYLIIYKIAAARQAAAPSEQMRTVWGDIPAAIP